MNAPLDESYLRWLYCQVADADVKDPSRTYWTLLRKFFTLEFIWFVPNDDNRVEDGRALRRTFAEENDLDDIDPDWAALDCSFLEMLIGLAHRLAFEAGGEVSGWFWQLVENIHLDVMNDDAVRLASDIEDIENVVMNVIMRRYKTNGKGGLFPLNDPKQNQLDVELWYQCQAYLLEND